MIKAVAFDMDGVLIDSQPLHYQIDMQVLKACGYPAKLEDTTPHTGTSNPDRWPKYKAAHALTQSVDELIEMQTQIMMETFRSENLSPIDGIPALLKYLNDKGIPCAVTSSSSHELINLVLEKCGIEQFFTHLVSGEDVKNGKPAPDIYLKAASVFELNPDSCLAIEDAPSGILAAKNAGFTCIAYKNPNTYGQDFTHADYVVSHFDEVVQKIL